jgi:glycosyltransferase involved in cell wall biosynthesis
MDNLLIIAIPFPTTRIVGASIRLEKFIKYLTKLDWIVFGITSDWLQPSDQISPVNAVITKIANPLTSFQSKEHLTISSNKTNRTTNAHNVLSLISKMIKSFAKYMIVPDEYSLWIIPSAYQARKIIKQNRIKAMLSMSPSAACHIAAWVACWMNQCCWIADFRDPWIGNPMQPRKFFLSELVNRILQRIVIFSADVVTVNTHELARIFSEQYPSQKHKIKIIYNGYDPDDFTEIPEDNLPLSQLTLAHVGSLYGNRNPLLLLDAIIALRDQYPDLDQRLVIKFVGYQHGDQEWLESLHNMALDKIFQVKSAVPHHEAINVMLESHVLLLLPGADYAVPGKIFEYMAARRPILSISKSDSEVANLIKRDRLGQVVSTAIELSNLLFQLINIVDQKEINRILEYDPDPIMIKTYSRAHQAAQLSTLFKECVMK